MQIHILRKTGFQQLHRNRRSGLPWYAGHHEQTRARRQCNKLNSLLVRIDIHFLKGQGVHRLVVDGDSVLATPDQLSGAAVAARVVGEAKGPKITAFNYKPKSNQRRRWGHRQRYSTVEITAMSKG